jgi:hypothetical protein
LGFPTLSMPEGTLLNPLLGVELRLKQFPDWQAWDLAPRAMQNSNYAFDVISSFGCK